MHGAPAAQPALWACCREGGCPHALPGCILPAPARHAAERDPSARPEALPTNLCCLHLRLTRQTRRAMRRLIDAVDWCGWRHRLVSSRVDVEAMKRQMQEREEAERAVRALRVLAAKPKPKDRPERPRCAPESARQPMTRSATRLRAATRSHRRRRCRPAPRRCARQPAKHPPAPGPLQARARTKGGAKSGGLRLLAPIFGRDFHTCWGAICNRHRDASGSVGLQCKKAMSKTGPHPSTLDVVGVPQLRGPKGPSSIDAINKKGASKAARLGPT